MKTHLLNSVKALSVTALISGGIAFSAPAYATSAQGDEVTTKIDIRDLKTERGVESIHKTLARRAKSACSTPGAKPIGSRIADRDCAENLLEHFVQDVGDERLTTYHEKMQS